MQPLPLSIAMPTRNRPGLLERALRWVVRAVAPVAEHIEVAVSDEVAAHTGRVHGRHGGARPKAS